MLTYVIAQGIGTAGTASLGKLLLLESGVGFGAVVAMLGLCTLTNFTSSVLAASAQPVETT